MVVGYVFSRVGLLGPFVAVLWIPLVGAAKMWTLFDPREQDFDYPLVIAPTIAILLLLVVLGIAALATYYYKTRFSR
jgi:hypothetical protein